MITKRTVFLLILACVAFLALAGTAYADCVGYHEEFDVQVLDAKGRPVPGADAWIKYDRGSTFGEQYFTTPPQKTDSNGMVHYTVINQGALTRPIDCGITVWGRVKDLNKTASVTALTHGSPIAIQLDVYPVNIYTRDQLGSEIPNATVTIGGDGRKSGPDGRLFYYFKSGAYNYLASYKDGKSSGTFEVKDDLYFEITFTFNRISIDIMDDNAVPLNATLTIQNQTLVMENGHFELNKTFGELIHYVIDYKGITSEGDIEPAVEANKKIIFDIHSPEIGKPVPVTTEGISKLVFSATDPGTYASGVDFRSAKVQYRLLPADVSTPWSNAVTFTSGKNQITAEFPQIPPDRIVQFRIEVKDKSSNLATLEGQFSTLGGNTQNTTNNETKPPIDGGQNQGIPLIYILIGVIVLILIVYAVFRLKTAGGKSA